MIPVRIAAIGEAEAVARVINSAFRPAEEFFVESDRISVDGVRALCATGAFFIAGDYAGAVYVELRGDRAYFGMLAVDPARQGAGIGRTLIAAVEDYARAHGSRFMDIRVVDLRTELPPRYRKLGYVETGSEPWPGDVPSKLPCRLLRMEKTL